MTNANEIVAQLQLLGSEGYKKTLLRHGIKEPCFGVKIEELKKIQKVVKKDYRLALDLYSSGVYDAMYLAGLIADDMKMSKEDLQTWAEGATCPMLSENTVAWVASESLFGREKALEWIDSKSEMIACAGWATLSSLASIKRDEDLDFDECKALLNRVENSIHQSPNRVRSNMNGFVIAVGCYIEALADFALQVATRIGKVSVDVGDTACKVSYAPDSIQKVRDRGTIGKKRKTAKC